MLKNAVKYTIFIENIKNSMFTHWKQEKVIFLRFYLFKLERIKNKRWLQIIEIYNQNSFTVKN